jgi:hypothetical protein
LISEATIVSSNNGLGVIDTAGEIGKISDPVSANTAGVTILMRIASVATREIRDID